MIQNAKITNYLKRTGIYSITILSNEAMFGLFSFCLLQFRYFLLSLPIIC